MILLLPHCRHQWCPDCQAVPAVVTGFKEHAIKQQSLITVVICDVGARELWKSGMHPLKSTTGDAPSLKLAGVPMIIHWENGAEKARLTTGLTGGQPSADPPDLSLPVLFHYSITPPSSSPFVNYLLPPLSTHTSQMVKQWNKEKQQ